MKNSVHSKLDNRKWTGTSMKAVETEMLCKIRDVRDILITNISMQDIPSGFSNHLLFFSLISNQHPARASVSCL